MISRFYIVSVSGQPRYNTNMYFTHRFPMVKFRLSKNLALDYSDFVDEGLRVAVFARSGGW
jgi:hypothetical protein